MAILPLAPHGVRQRRRVGSIADNCPSDLPPALPRAFVGPSATPTSGVPSPGGGVDAPDTVGSSDGACVNAVLRIRAILALLRTCSRRGVAVTLVPSHDCLPDTIASAISSSLGDRRPRSRAQAAPRAAAGGPARRLEPNGCGRVARHRSASHLGSAAGRLDRFSLERLVRFLGSEGGSIELQISWSSRHSFLYAPTRPL